MNVVTSDTVISTNLFYLFFSQFILLRRTCQTAIPSMKGGDGAGHRADRAVKGEPANCSLTKLLVLAFLFGECKYYCESFRPDNESSVIITPMLSNKHVGVTMTFPKAEPDDYHKSVAVMTQLFLDKCCSDIGGRLPQLLS